MSTRGYSGDSEEGLAPKDLGVPEDLACDATFRETTPRGTRAELIAQMNADREQRRGNRSGSPNRLARYDIGASAKVYGLRALATIVEIMENEKEAAPVRLAAAKEVLDRGFGRPKQITEIGGLDGDEIRNRLVIEFVGVPAKSSAAPGESLQSRTEGVKTASQVSATWANQVGEVLENQHNELVRVVDANEVALRPEFVSGNPFSRK